jgi:hypothetical protein
MRPPPNAKAPAPIDQEPHALRSCFEHRIEWTERYGAHHQEAGSSGMPHESLIAVVGGVAIAAGEYTGARPDDERIKERKNSWR